MDLAISCHPPLGLATVVDTAHVRFTVGINSTSVQTQPKGRWDLAIWHNNCPNGAWAELPLTEVCPGKEPLHWLRLGLTDSL
jgi:hypothetical protein